MNLMLLLVATILCTSLSQVLQKRLSLCLSGRKAVKSSAESAGPCTNDVTYAEACVSGHTADDTNMYSRTRLSLSLIHSIFWLAVGLVLWFFVLAQMEVSRAYPLLSLNVIVVMLLSAKLFAEKISVLQVIGIVAILSGVFLLTAGDLP